LLGLSIVSSSAQTQQEKLEATVSITNICSQSVLVIQVVQLTLNGAPLATRFIFPGQQINPGETATFTMDVTAVPNDLTISGTLDGQGFAIKIDELVLDTPISDREHCMKILVSLGGEQTEQPTAKPVVEGQTFEQTLAALQAAGINISTEGSQAAPKLSDVGDPMLLRAIPAFSAQVLFVSSGAGTLRSVISWDQPAVDLDLIVFGLPGGFCFQLTAPGVLAETCDRAPFGPVPGVVFAVLVINWSPVSQAYVLSLSS